MISVSNLGRYGRLGNQMFQYACAFSAAKRLDTKVAISSHDSYRIASKNQLIETFELNNVLIDRFEDIRFVFSESSFSYDERILKILDNTDLVGYFQSEKYFKSSRTDLIQNQFIFKDKIVNNVESLYKKIKDFGEMCSIHVRLGDYKNLSKVHNNLNIEYYQKSIENIPRCGSYIIFSDEIQIAKEMLDPVLNHVGSRVFYSELNESECLYLMSLCDYHIIANSSFSWWGAWLSNSKMTISPKLWFGPDGPRAWEDIYCTDWKIIS